jgi:protein-disulfide isomerase
VRQKLVEFGQSSGLNEVQVRTCIADPAGAQRFQRVVDQGTKQFSITGTPTLILNGQKLNTDTDPSLVTYEGLSRAIDTALAGRR